MTKFTRKPQETEETYFFSGQMLITQGAIQAFTEEEVMAVVADLKAFVAAQNGADYLQVYEFADGRKLWIIDQLNKEMIESGDFQPEDNHCTILLPEEYWILLLPDCRSSIFV